MRILLDANMSPAVAAFLNNAGHETALVQEALPPATTDPDVARFAIEKTMHVVTADRGFSYQVEKAGITFPHAIVTLRAKDYPESPGTWLLLLSTLLSAHPAWDEHTHYVVDPDRIRIRKT